MKLLKEILILGSQILAAFVVAMAINVFIFQPTRVEGQSMEPTLHNGDKVILNKLPHTFRSEPDYGDIIVIDSRVEKPRSIKDDIQDILTNNIVVVLISQKSKQEEIFWVKRVVGKPGDVLEFKSGKVIRNGEILEEPYIKEQMRYAARDKIIVPEGHVYVMGDNRNFSKDSRSIGPVPIDHVIGKYVVKIGG